MFLYAYYEKGIGAHDSKDECAVCIAWTHKSAVKKIQSFCSYKVNPDSVWKIGICAMFEKYRSNPQWISEF